MRGIRSAVSVSPETDTVTLRSRSILVADDVQFTRKSLVRMLRQMGHTEVYEAEDGAAALRVLEGRPIDCVISDLEMPKLSGPGLLRAIRSGVASIARDVPVIFYTAYSELELLGPALLLDPDAILAKPVSQKALQHCLERLLDPRKTPERALAEASFYAQIELSPPIPEQTDDTGSFDKEPAGRAVPVAKIPVNAVLARHALRQWPFVAARRGQTYSADSRPFARCAVPHCPS